MRIYYGSPGGAGKDPASREAAQEGRGAAGNAGRGVALGYFDGVHKGHLTLLRTLVAECRARGLTPAVYTFANHPSSVLDPSGAPRLLSTNAEKAALMEAEGIEELYFDTFDTELASLSPGEFVDGVLAGRLGASLAVAGENYSFGRFGAGKSGDLRKLCRSRGIEALIVPGVRVALPGEGAKARRVTVSSTLIREQLAEGKVELYRLLTGRDFTLEGEVIKGRAVGRTMGFPTANIIPDGSLRLPGEGVYATRVRLPEGVFRGMTNIGDDPTFGDVDHIAAETYLLDFHGDLYGRRIRVEFIRRMRDQRVFGSAEELSERLSEDMRERREMEE